MAHFWVKIFGRSDKICSLKDLFCRGLYHGAKVVFQESSFKIIH